jgi:hypothetical protein
VNITNNGFGTNNQISWGNPAGQPSQSSYVLTGLNGSVLELDDILAGDLFLVGTFTHNNFPITQGNFLGTDLTLTFNIPELGVAGAQFGPFGFAHLETPNREPCNPAGNPPCPDVVTIPNAQIGIPFTFNGQSFEFFIAGFRESPGSPVIPQFITQEGLENNANLFAGVRIIGAPEPMTGTLIGLGLGLLGLAVINKRRKN